MKMYPVVFIGVAVVLMAGFFAVHKAQAASCVPTSLVKVTFGQSSASVANLQQCLIDAGYSIPAGATGYYGAQTRAAVRAFYAADMSLPDWDGGSVGPQGRGILAKKFAGTPVTPPITSDNPGIINGGVKVGGGVIPSQNLPQPVVTVPVPVGTTTVFTGKIVCLPHKDTSGPVDMMCVYGLQDGSGKYYGLLDSDPKSQRIMNTPMDKKVTVTGKLIYQEDGKYQNVGTIIVTEIKVSEN